MTKPVTTGTRPSPTPVRLPGVASTAIHGLISGSRIDAAVLHTSRRAIWLQAGEQIIAVAVGEEARLPNGVHLPAGTPMELLEHAATEPTASVGFGRIVIGGLAVTVTRWWDPHPRPPAVTIDVLATRSAGLPSAIPDIKTERLQAALVAQSAGGILHSSRTLLGRGLGLTPEGDVLLAGAVAATRVLGEASGRDRFVSLIAGISLPLDRLAEARTNVFSTAMIRLALRGQVVEPAGELLRALAGRGAVATSHLGLIRFHRTAGPALAAGIVIGTHALVESSRLA